MVGRAPRRRSARGARRGRRPGRRAPRVEAAQVSAIRSETSKPLFLRASCTIRITSRASPARTQLVGQLEVERDGLALLVDHRPALARALGDDHLVGQHLDRRTVRATHRGPAVGGQRRGQRAGVGRGDRGGHRGACPWRTACRARGSCPWRCGRPGRRRPRRAARCAPTLSSSATSRRSSSLSRAYAADADQRAAQRLPGAHLGLGAGGAAELDQPPGQPHLLAIRVSSTRLPSTPRPGGQVHRLGQLLGGRRRTCPARPAR